MRVTLVILWWALACFFGVPHVRSDLGLERLLSSLKGGPFAKRVGPGGLLALSIAGTQDGLGTSRRARSSAHEELRLAVNTTDSSDSESELLQNITNNLNNVSMPATRRVMRQVAILDQLSCLPKLICGLNTREPSKRTSLINDYGFLIKYLFERDDEDDDPQEDEEEEDDDPLGRTAGTEMSLTQKTKLEANKKGNKGSLRGEPDDDDDTSDSAEEFMDDDYKSIKDMEDDKLDDLAQDTLLENEPELLMYAMAEMKNRYKKRIPDINKNYGLDQTDVPGYSKDDYKIIPNPLLNTDVASAILKQRSKYTLTSTKGGTDENSKPGWNIGHNKKVNFDVADASEEQGGVLGSLMPSFLFSKKKVSVSKPNSDDPFAGDPFFDDFKRSLKMTDLKGDHGQVEDIRNEFELQRRNSRYNPLSFFKSNTGDNHDTSDLLKKYDVAEETGRQTKSGRQCRMLFAKCPYSTDEITTMIDNVKKLVTNQKTIGDKVITLKQHDHDGGSSSSGNNIATLLNAKTSGGGTIEVPVGGGGGKGGGTTQITHQLDNGDKVDIILKIQPGEKNVVQMVPVPVQVEPDPELVKANKTLQEMRKALQVIARLHNQTELAHVKRNKEQSISELFQDKLNAVQSEPIAPASGSAESGSDESSSKSTEQASSRPAIVPVAIAVEHGDHKEVKLSKTKKPSGDQEDDGVLGNDEDDDDDDDDDEDEDEDEEEEEDDPRRPDGNDLHFYRNSPTQNPVPTRPPAKNSFSPFYFTGLNVPFFSNKRQEPQPQQRPHPSSHHHHHHQHKPSSGPVLFDHVAAPKPTQAKLRPDLKAKNDQIRRHTILKGSQKSKKNQTRRPTLTKAKGAAVQHGNSTVPSNTLTPKGSSKRQPTTRKPASIKRPSSSHLQGSPHDRHNTVKNASSRRKHVPKSSTPRPRRTKATKKPRVTTTTPKPTTTKPLQVFSALMPTRSSSTTIGSKYTSPSAATSTKFTGNPSSTSIPTRAPTVTTAKRDFTSTKIASRPTISTSRQVASTTPLPFPATVFQSPSTNITHSFHTRPSSSSQFFWRDPADHPTTEAPTTFYIVADPITIPKSTPRPDRVTGVRPASKLPPKPERYKIHRKEGNRRGNQEISPNTKINKRRG